MADRRRLGLLALWAAVLVVAAVMFLRPRPAPVAEDAPAAEPVAPAPASASARAFPQHRSADAATLPPHDAPLTQVIGPLQARADAGDSLAACRLAMELLRCERVNAAIAKFDGIKRSLEDMESAGMLAHAQSLADQLSWDLTLKEQCSALPANLRTRTSDYLTQAARAGEPEAMLHYADAAHLGNLEGLALHRTADFDAWRRDAPAMLQRALQAGRAEAVQMLRLAYQIDYSPLGGIIEDDPVDAQAYTLMFNRLSQTREIIDVSLDPQQLAKARALADERYQRYFSSRPPAAGPVKLILTPPGMAPGSNDSATFCDSP